MATRPTVGDLERAADAVRDLIRCLGLDPDVPELAGTPERVVSSFSEMLGGTREDPSAPLRRGDAVPIGTEMVSLSGIGFRSVCAHHLLPFSGTANITYLPHSRIVGIGSIVRCLEILSTRPQMQEKLGQELADMLVSGAGASGAVVVLEARHACIADRGPREAESQLRTVAAAGDTVDSRFR